MKTKSNLIVLSLFTVLASGAALAALSPASQTGISTTKQPSPVVAKTYVLPSPQNIVKLAAQAPITENVFSRINRALDTNNSVADWAQHKAGSHTFFAGAC